MKNSSVSVCIVHALPELRRLRQNCHKRLKIPIYKISNMSYKHMWLTHSDSHNLQTPALWVTSCSYSTSLAFPPWDYSGASHHQAESCELPITWGASWSSPVLPPSRSSVQALVEGPWAESKTMSKVKVCRIKFLGEQMIMRWNPLFETAARWHW